MADTYTKTLVSLTITMNNHDTFTVDDTLDCMIASQVLTQLESGHPATVFVDDEEYIIYPGGVSHIKVERTQSEEIPVRDIC